MPIQRGTNTNNSSFTQILIETVYIHSCAYQRKRKSEIPKMTHWLPSQPNTHTKKYIKSENHNHSAFHYNHLRVQVQLNSGHDLVKSRQRVPSIKQ